MFISLFFQVVAAHEPSKFPETRSKVSNVTQQITVKTGQAYPPRFY